MNPRTQQARIALVIGLAGALLIVGHLGARGIRLP